MLFVCLSLIKTPKMSDFCLGGGGGGVNMFIYYNHVRNRNFMYRVCLSLNTLR